MTVGKLFFDSIIFCSRVVKDTRERKNNFLSIAENCMELSSNLFDEKNTTNSDEFNKDIPSREILESKSVEAYLVQSKPDIPNISRDAYDESDRLHSDDESDDSGNPTISLPASGGGSLNLSLKKNPFLEKENP